MTEFKKDPAFLAKVDAANATFDTVIRSLITLGETRAVEAVRTIRAAFREELDG